MGDQGDWDELKAARMAEFRTAVRQELAGRVRPRTATEAAAVSLGEGLLWGAGLALGLVAVGAVVEAFRAPAQTAPPPPVKSEL